MNRPPLALVFIACTSALAVVATDRDLQRPAVLLRQAQVDSSTSGHTQFAVRQEPAFQWQRRVQYNASSALQQIDEVNIPPDGQYNFPNTADGVDVYIFDSGVRASHSEFRTVTPDGNIVTNTRVRQLYSSQQGWVEDDAASQELGSSGVECAEHGTHVASLVGGLTYGAAKGVNLKALQVLNCDGSTDAAKLINATEWLVDNVQRPAVVVMAIGEIGRIHQLDRAIEKCESLMSLTYSLWMYGWRGRS